MAHGFKSRSRNVAELQVCSLPPSRGMCERQPVDVSLTSMPGPFNYLKAIYMYKEPGAMATKWTTKQAGDKAGRGVSER